MHRMLPCVHITEINMQEESALACHCECAFERSPLARTIKKMPLTARRFTAFARRFSEI
jgi:hypothetical protein